MNIGAIELDADQARAAARLDELLDRHGRPVKRHRGIYLHGRPGRGKTMVMNQFFGSVTSNRKHRFHFHAFFARLTALRAESGAIDRAIDTLLGDARLVCFDEFHVHDIGDAMLITRVLDALFARGIVLVVTSNYPPEKLLPNPLFHDRFLPTIARIVANLEVVSVDGPLDYRTRVPRDPAATGFRAGRYLVGAESALWRHAVIAADGESDRRGGAVVAPAPGRAGMNVASTRVGEPHPDGGPEVVVGARRVHARSVEGAAIVFDFAKLCGTPTSSADYVELAQRFSTWTLCDVPALRAVAVDWVMRLVNLIDVLYDADLSLTVSARVPLADLVADIALPDISRTASRLSELDQLGDPLGRGA
ncbi:cell division protein ZapE [Nocardia australiensis]|uniref:cell division protein ZapE n=1 Tax=Nocardia australiensis TaxID=2887191 RepID=UPI001D14FCA0|nr:cell division protein ZapE [Nocardia australiensis]